MVELTALSFRSTKDPRLITNTQKKYTVACCTIVLESDRHLIDPDLRVILLRFGFKLDIQAQDRRIIEKFWLLFGTSISESLFFEGNATESPVLHIRGFSSR